jgi:membrane-bound serine protease (ClpP class)
MLILYIAIILSMLARTEAQSTGRIVEIINVDGIINPASASYIHEAVTRANKEKAECLIIELNTPGGLLKSTRIIVSDIFGSKVPVIVYVAPSGAQAASAGVFITLAANVAAMAPGTNIGAAHPVMMQEGGGANRKDSLNIMMEKATNDAAAFMRTIAEKRGRNVEWAENSVRRSLSLTETEALSADAIDIIVPCRDSLLKALDSMKIITASGWNIIHTKNAEIRITPMNTAQKLLDIISDPNIAYILLMIGMYGLMFELYNPGSILPGIVGFISLVLAFYSFNSLPVNYAGFALILFGVILFIAEIKVASHGLLSAGGILSLLTGSLMLLNTSPAFEIVKISLSVIITSTAATAAFFAFALSKGIAAQQIHTITGSEGMIGETGITLSPLVSGLPGQVMLHGEIWKAIPAGKEIKQDEKVTVTAIKDLILTVEKYN